MHAPFLQPNDEIRILSTARKISEEELNPFKNYLEAEGYKVTYAKNLFREEHQFAGKDEERFADLQEAINDPEVKVIWMARGGYGSHRIIEALDVEHLKEDPKWIIGYSDVTVIHSFLQRRHIESVHGPMPVNFDPEDTEPFDACLDLLKSGHVHYSIPSHPFNKNGEARGTLIGGNLSILYSLNGTPLMPKSSDAILFIEDLDEYLYHVDRMMMNLKLSGFLKGLNGVILGGMSDMNDNTIPFGKNALEIMNEHLGDLGIPVCYEFPAGHIKTNMPLLLGAEVNLLVKDNGADISY